VGLCWWGGGGWRPPPNPPTPNPQTPNPQSPFLFFIIKNIFIFLYYKYYKYYKSINLKLIFLIYKIIMKNDKMQVKIINNIFIVWKYQ